MAPILGDEPLPEGTLLFARITGHPMWPGQVIREWLAPPKIRMMKSKDTVLLLFFGDQQFGWFPRKSLYHFEDKYPTQSSGQDFKKNKKYRKAIEEAKEVLDRRSGEQPTTSHGAMDILRPETYNREYFPAVSVPAEPEADALKLVTSEAALQWIRALAIDTLSPDVQDTLDSDVGRVSGGLCWASQWSQRTLLSSVKEQELADIEPPPMDGTMSDLQAMSLPASTATTPTGEGKKPSSKNKVSTGKKAAELAGDDGGSGSDGDQVGKKVKKDKKVRDSDSKKRHNDTDSEREGKAEKKSSKKSKKHRDGSDDEGIHHKVSSKKATPEEGHAGDAAGHKVKGLKVELPKGLGRFRPVDEHTKLMAFMYPIPDYLFMYQDDAMDHEGREATKSQEPPSFDKDTEVRYWGPMGAPAAAEKLGNEEDKQKLLYGGTLEVSLEDALHWLRDTACDHRIRAKDNNTVASLLTSQHAVAMLRAKEALQLKSSLNRYGEVGSLTRSAMELQGKGFTTPAFKWPGKHKSSAPPPLLTTRTFFPDMVPAEYRNDDDHSRSESKKRVYLDGQKGVARKITSTPPKSEHKSSKKSSSKRVVDDYGLESGDEHAARLGHGHDSDGSDVDMDRVGDELGHKKSKKERKKEKKEKRKEKKKEKKRRRSGSDDEQEVSHKKRSKKHDDDDELAADENGHDDSGSDGPRKSSKRRSKAEKAKHKQLLIQHVLAKKQAAAGGGNAAALGAVAKNILSGAVGGSGALKSEKGHEDSDAQESPSEASDSEDETPEVEQVWVEKKEYMDKIPTTEPAFQSAFQRWQAERNKDCSATPYIGAYEFRAYDIFLMVAKEGGCEAVTVSQKWQALVDEWQSKQGELRKQSGGVPAPHNPSAVLRKSLEHHYRKLLLDFENYVAGKCPVTKQLVDKVDSQGKLVYKKKVKRNGSDDEIAGDRYKNRPARNALPKKKYHSIPADGKPGGRYGLDDFDDLADKTDMKRVTKLTSGGVSGKGAMSPKGPGAGSSKYDRRYGDDGAGKPRGLFDSAAKQAQQPQEALPRRLHIRYPERTPMPSVARAAASLKAYIPSLKKEEVTVNQARYIITADCLTTDEAERVMGELEHKVYNLFPEMRLERGTHVPIKIVEATDKYAPRGPRGPYSDKRGREPEQLAPHPAVAGFGYGGSSGVASTSGRGLAPHPATLNRYDDRPSGRGGRVSSRQAQRNSMRMPLPPPPSLREEMYPAHDPRTAAANMSAAEAIVAFALKANETFGGDQGAPPDVFAVPPVSHLSAPAPAPADPRRAGAAGPPGLPEGLGLTTGASMAAAVVPAQNTAAPAPAAGGTTDLAAQVSALLAALGGVFPTGGPAAAPAPGVSAPVQGQASDNAGNPRGGQGQPEAAPGSAGFETGLAAVLKSLQG